MTNNIKVTFAGCVFRVIYWLKVCWLMYVRSTVKRCSAKTAYCHILPQKSQVCQLRRPPYIQGLHCRGSRKVTLPILLSKSVNIRKHHETTSRVKIHIGAWLQNRKRRFLCKIQIYLHLQIIFVQWIRFHHLAFEDSD